MTSVEQTMQNKLHAALDIKEIGPLEYEGLNPLFKPAPKSRGVYGGALCAQAIMAAMRTVPAGFAPHSLHSYFVKAGDDSKVCQYKVEKISDGNNFANRLVRVFQEGELKYVVMTSTTKRNSIKKTAQGFEETGKGPRPFEYQRKVDDNFYKYKPEDVSFKYVGLEDLVEYRLPPNLADRELYQDGEAKKAVGDRELSFYLKITDKGPFNTDVKYASLGVITDTLYLGSIPRLLHFPFEIYTKSFFSLSLDHSIYFHDDDFNPSDWLYCRYHSPRFSNNRALFEAGYYAPDGRLVATIVQEGLVFFKNDSELQARL